MGLTSFRRQYQTIFRLVNFSRKQLSSCIEGFIFRAGRNNFDNLLGHPDDQDSVLNLRHGVLLQPDRADGGCAHFYGQGIREYLYKS